MILADANIWIDFFRRGQLQLRKLLENNQIVMHAHVVAELALGSLKNRTRVLAELDNMPALRTVALPHVRQMIETRSLYTKGIGLSDAHLVASCLATPGALLWTSDARLGKVAESLGIRK